MRLKRTLAVLASAAASALAAGAMLASPASAAPQSARVIHPDGTTFTGLTLSASTVFFGSEQIEVASFAVSNISGPAIGGTVTVFAGNAPVCSGPVTPFQGSITLSAGSCAFRSSQLAPGNYQVAAGYSGDQNGNFASSSGIKSLVVGGGLTSSALEPSAPDATFGGEHQVALFVTVQPQASTATVDPTGGFRITDENGNLICNGALGEFGTAACTPSDSALHAGEHNLTVSYLGDSNYQGSTSSAQDFFVFKAATTTTMTLPATTLAFDEEGGLLVNYQVTSSAGVIPTGSVAVTTATGLPVCGGSLSNGSCALSDQVLPPGNYQLTATYSGDGDNAVSTSTAQALTITRESTTTTAALSAPRTTFGREQAERISVAVTPRTSGTPTGQVTITAGSAVVCRATLTAGKASCAPGATKLRPGTYHLTASYPGDSTFASSSGQVTLTVAPEPTSTSLALSAATVRSGHERAERLTVKVKPAVGGTPAGVVTVKAGSATICTIVLTNGKGTCTLAASKLRPGTYKLVARYGGRSPYAPSVSAKKNLTVTR